jgi:hypothetical protein
MPAAAGLGRQFEEALSAVRAAGVAVARIGGLALAPHNVVRATYDVDLLADGDPADGIDRVAAGLGYRCLYRSTGAASFLQR